ncbi:MAG: hypothetical protein JXB45_09805 [Candidatus Krumholzibacteriota bacterium]|nr:hypothetical protein [Candidatus Krumholzibacteriota bacterium]
MWIVRGIILLISVVVLVWLGTVNAGTRVTFFLHKRPFDTELNLIMVISFVAGMVVWAIGAWVREAQLLFKLMKVKKTNRRLQDEISDLRNLPLEEEDLIETDK